MGKMYVGLLLLFALYSSGIDAQNKLGENPDVVADGSLLELESSTKGLRLPRYKLDDVSTWKLDGTAVSGMVIFNAEGSAPRGLYYWDIDKSQWMLVQKSLDGVVYYGVLPNTSPTVSEVQTLANKTLSSGLYTGNFDQALTSVGYFTLAIPVAWRNPSLKIDGSDTWNVLNATATMSINNVEYQIWQTDVELESGVAIVVR